VTLAVSGVSLSVEFPVPPAEDDLDPFSTNVLWRWIGVPLLPLWNPLGPYPPRAGLHPLLSC
jgi:hypothetical protein